MGEEMINWMTIFGSTFIFAIAMWIYLERKQNRGNGRLRPTKISVLTPLESLSQFYAIIKKNYCICH